MTKVLAACAVVALLLAFVFSSMNGRTVLSQVGIPTSSLPQVYEFEVSSTSQLLEFTMVSDVQNAAAIFEAQVTGPDGTPLASGARASEFYSGRTGGERWTEGSRRTSFRIRPTATGRHTVTLALSDLQVWQVTDPQVTEVSLTVREGQPTGLYLLIVGGAFALGALGLAGRKALHSRRRWAMGDWTDEE